VAICLLLVILLSGKWVNYRLGKVNSVASSDKSDSSLEAELMYAEIGTRKFLKLCGIFICIFLFTIIYHLYPPCLPPQVICGNGGAPICISSGLPPLSALCDESGMPNCAWSPNTQQSVEVVCPSEEVKYGMSDNGEFEGTYGRHFVIGVANGFDIDNIPANNLQNTGLGYLVSPNNTFAYGEPDKLTYVQNLLTTLPNLPYDNTTNNIVAVALVPDGTACSAVNIGNSATPIIAPTFFALRAMRYVQVYTPSSPPSNYVMCYMNNEAVWSAVPGAWVVIAPLGGCSAPDCTSADFNGIGSDMLDSFYFTMVVQATFGYGDVLALSPRARVMVAIQELIMVLLECI